MEIKELLSEETLQKRIKELAKQIESDYLDEEITILCILKGAAPFTMDLVKNMKNEIIFEYMQLSSYFGKESTGNVIIKKDIDKNTIEGKNILIVEDIVDTGRSMKLMKQIIQEKKAKTIKICTLLNKKSRRVVDLDIDYIGFEIEDKFVVGYGLDYDEKYRNLPYIGYIE